MAGDINPNQRDHSNSNHPNIDTIVFDLGGVLVDWNPRYLYRKLISDPNEIEKFLTEVCHGSWNEMQDAGRPFAEGIAELVERHPDKEDLIRAYFDRWTEMLGGALEGVPEILSALHRSRRYRLFALSNWSSETFPRARAMFPFLDLFEKVLLSGEERLIKPDPRFFALLSTRHGVVPHRAIFIDDVDRNITEAARLGFHAIRFTDAETLRLRLAECGVKVKE